MEWYAVSLGFLVAAVIIALLVSPSLRARLRGLGGVGLDLESKGDAPGIHVRKVTSRTAGIRAEVSTGGGIEAEGLRAAGDVILTAKSNNQDSYDDDPKAGDQR